MAEREELLKICDDFIEGYYPDSSSYKIARALKELLSPARGDVVPVAWLRDVDGTGSLHVCAKGDPGAIPVFATPTPPSAEGETPRTDAAIRDFGYRDEHGNWWRQDAIDPGFARQLERELNALRAAAPVSTERMVEEKGESWKRADGKGYLPST